MLRRGESNLALTTENVNWPLKRVKKLTFWKLALHQSDRRRANAWDISFFTLCDGQFYIFNSVVNTKLPYLFYVWRKSSMHCSLIYAAVSVNCYVISNWLYLWCLIFLQKIKTAHGQHRKCQISSLCCRWNKERLHYV